MHTKFRLRKIKLEEMSICGRNLMPIGLEVGVQLPKGRSKIGPFSGGDIANIANVANTEQIE